MASIYEIQELVKDGDDWFILEYDGSITESLSHSLLDYLREGWDLVIKEKRCLPRSSFREETLPGVYTLKEVNVYILRRKFEE